MSADTGGAALLTEAEKDQLLAYIKWADESAVYYGVKRHYDKRHARLRKWAFELPTVESERARRTEGK